MAWFLNLYKCDRCRRRWADEWSCMCDDECPHCGARDMTPYESEELTTLIEEERGEFVVLWSPETAEHDPDYRELGRFLTREKALEFCLPTDDSNVRHSGDRGRAVLPMLPSIPEVGQPDRYPAREAP
jgi:hypothetical protein